MKLRYCLLLLFLLQCDAVFCDEKNNILLGLSVGQGSSETNLAKGIDFDAEYIAATFGIFLNDYVLSVNHMDSKHEYDDLDFELIISSAQITYELGSRERSFTGFSLGLGKLEIFETDYTQFLLGISHTRSFTKSIAMNLGGEYGIFNESEDDRNDAGKSQRYYIELGYNLDKVSFRAGFQIHDIDFDNAVDYKSNLAYIKLITVF